MAFVEVDKEKILAELRKTDYQSLVESFKKLKEEWTWKIFDNEGWEKFKSNIDLLSSLLEKVAITVEKVAVVTIGITNGGSKLEAAVKFLDEIIKFPFYIEFFDQYVFRVLISLAVSKLNDKIGHDWKAAGLLEI